VARSGGAFAEESLSPLIERRFADTLVESKRADRGPRHPPPCQSCFPLRPTSLVDRHAMALRNRHRPGLPPAISNARHVSATSPSHPFRSRVAIRLGRMPFSELIGGACRHSTRSQVVPRAACLATQCDPQMRQNLAQATGPASVGSRNQWKTFGENLSGTAGAVAEEFTTPPEHGDGYALPRKVP
jgi:hypothetical protein